jgi:hypothetical protein
MFLCIFVRPQNCVKQLTSFRCRCTHYIYVTCRNLMSSYFAHARPIIGISERCLKRCGTAASVGDCSHTAAAWTCSRNTGQDHGCGLGSVVPIERQRLMPTRQGELRQIPFSLTPSSLGICPAYHLCKNINLLT